MKQGFMIVNNNTIRLTEVLVQLLRSDTTDENQFRKHGAP